MIYLEFLIHSTIQNLLKFLENLNVPKIETFFEQYIYWGTSQYIHLHMLQKIKLILLHVCIYIYVKGFVAAAGVRF